MKAVVAGRPQEFRGREIILCCGAIHSPAHLMRAGIGPVAHLRDLGIDVRAALPGVGQRLQDHPGVAIAAFLKPHARMIQNYTRMHMFTALRYSSNLPGIPPGDMCALVANKTAWHKVGQQLGSFVVMVYRPTRKPVRYGSARRTGRTNRWWISTCCRTAGTWSG